MRSPLFGVFLIALCLVVSSTAPGAIPPLADLKRDADAALALLDDIARRHAITPVFALAGRYAATGNTNEALAYYQKGLAAYPWNLDGQLAVARILQSAGDTNGARQKAQLVWKHAETDALLSGAAELLAASPAAWTTRRPTGSV